MRLFLLLLGNIALFLSEPAAATWRVAETAHFRLYGEQSEAALRERVTLLEDFSKLLGLLTTGIADVEGAPPLDVFLVDNIADARPFGRIEGKIGGFYVSSAGRIAAFSETGDFGQIILLHEYTHHFMLGHASFAYPKWYVEGFADYFATAVFKSDTVEFGGLPPGRAQQLMRGIWLPMERVLARDPMLKSQRETHAFYAQSWLMAHYLLRVPGQRDKLTAYLRAVAAGTDSPTAFRQHIDPDLAAFERRLRRYLTSRDITYSRFDRPAASAQRVTVATLPPSADALLMKLTALELSLPPDAAKALAATRAAAAKFPGDPLAERTLALAELRLGDRTTAGAMIDLLLDRAPNDATLLRWRAQSLNPLAPGTTAADRGEARRLLVRSFQADPGDWRTMLAYVRIASQPGRPLSASDLEVALRARELAPQVPEIVIAAAVGLARADRLADAAKVLEPLAFSPHESSSTAFARRLLERMRARDAAGLLAILRQ